MTDTKVTNYTPSVGRRKQASARIRLSKGTGSIIVNEKKLEEYLTVPTLQTIVKKPLTTVGLSDTYDVTVKVVGGGMNGQAGAIALGIARALVKLDEAHRPALKAAGLLKVDAREKERKKFGLRKARRAPQWSKR